MNTEMITDHTTKASPRLIARIAGATYLVVILTGGGALLMGGKWGAIAGLISGVCYIAVTLLFYHIFKPANQRLSLLAAIVSLTGCAFAVLGGLKLITLPIHNLVFFGVYCSLIAYLIFKSTFLPKYLWLVMAFAGMGWLTFLSPSLAAALMPYNFAPGIIGETMLTLWLLVFGVDVERWNRQAARTHPQS
jgi:hypothetical protein